MTAIEAASEALAMQLLSPPPVSSLAVYLRPMHVVCSLLCGLAVAACSPGPMPVSHAANDPSNPHAAEATVYACPMHPEVTAPAPGKCGKCGMDLAPTK